MSGNNNNNPTWTFNLVVGVLLIILLPHQQQSHGQHVFVTTQHVANASSSSSSSLSSFAAIYNDRASNFVRVGLYPSQPLPSRFMAKHEVNNFKSPGKPYFLYKDSISTEHDTYINDLNTQDDDITAPEGDTLISKQNKLSSLQHNQKFHTQSEILSQSNELISDEADKVESGGDILDINPPYDDTDSEIDIILETKDSNENRGEEKDFKTNQHTDTGLKSEKSIFYKKVKQPPTLIEDNNNRSKNNSNSKEGNKYSPLNAYANNKIEDYYNVGDDDSDGGDDAVDDRSVDNLMDGFEVNEVSEERDEDDDDDDDDDGSAEFEKFKSIHERRQRENKQRVEQQQQQITHDEHQKQQQQQQLQQKMVSLNAKKLQEWKWKENFNNNNNIISDNNAANDISAARAIIIANATKDNAAIGDISEALWNKDDANKATLNTMSRMKTSQSILPIANSNTFAEVLIPRKRKRHNSAARLYDDDVTNRYASNPTQYQSERVNAQTAFDKQKAMKRNNRRAGHKTHKKRYKDYLRYMIVDEVVGEGVAPKTPVIAGATVTHILTHHTTQPNKDENNPVKHEKRTQVPYAPQRQHSATFRVPPIFAVKPNRSKQLPGLVTRKPFYEGQINYYAQTNDEEAENAKAKMPSRSSKHIKYGDKRRGEADDKDDWLKHLSPVLRNGIKATGRTMDRSEAYKRYMHAGAKPRNHQRYHHRGHRYDIYHPHHHAEAHKKHSKHHAYPRNKSKINTSASLAPFLSPNEDHNAQTTTELGHQISDVKELKQYYAKWPHLARVQFQVYDENYREQHPELYADIDYDNLLDNQDDYEDGAEQSNTQTGGDNDENLPPYVKKYNRRNEQLLNLLEGTLAPIIKAPSFIATGSNRQWKWSNSKLQPGPKDSSLTGTSAIRIDDDYLKEKRRRYQNYQQSKHDLFEQQRNNKNEILTTTATTTTTTSYFNHKQNKYTDLSHDNHLPDEYISVSIERADNGEQPANDMNDAKGGAERDSDDFNYNLTNSNSRNEGEEKGDDDANGNATTDNCNNNVSNGDDNDDDDVSICQEEIETKSKSGNLELATTSKTTTTTTMAPFAYGNYKMKAAYRKLPSYPNMAAGNYMNQLRSRSMQFAPSSGSELRKTPPLKTNSNSINSNIPPTASATADNNYEYKPTGNWTRENRESLQALMFNTWQQIATTTTSSPLHASAATFFSSNTNSTKSDNNQNHNHQSTVSNSFEYHRVLGSGGGNTGHKQRLPFVAITDRRLETSKKTPTEHQKYYQQNLYPLP